MKREKARLEALRCMAYEAYRETPEWHETRSGAIKRAGDRCQVCNAEGGLEVYHKSFENLGCEQEQDLIVLCGGCFERLAQQLGRELEDGDGETTIALSLWKKAAVFVPSALVGLGLPILLHAPLPAEVFGLAAALALAVNSPRIYGELRESLPQTAVEVIDRMIERKQARVARGEWSNWDRLWGRHMRTDDRSEATQADEARDDQVEELTFNFAEGHRLPAFLDLASDVHLAPNEIIGKSIFIAGQRRSGKTTLGALLAEQMGDQYIPLFIPDREGDYLSVYEHLPRGVIAGAPGSYDDQPDITFWAVTPEDADVLGFQILYEGMQVVLDLNTFALEEGFQVVNGVIKGLFDFAAQYPKQRCPVEVFLDEAQRYLPQDLSTSWIKDAEIRDTLLDLYRDLLSTGGKRGLTPVILSQRFAETNNKIMAQAEVRFILRQTHDTDLDRCMKYVEKGVSTREQIHAFQKGEGIFVSDDGTQFVTRFNTRRSDGARSHTPGAEAAVRYIDMPLSFQRNPRSRVPDRRQVPGTPVPEKPSEQPEPHKTVSHSSGKSDQMTRKYARERRMREGSTQYVPSARSQAEQSQSAPPAEQASLPITDLTAYLKPEQRIPDLAEVVAAFPDQLPGKRDIARHFGITDHQAYKLYKHLEKTLEEAAGRVGGRVNEERIAKK